MEELKMDVDLFAIDGQEEDLSIFDKEEKNQDGLFRPSLANAKDKSKGYQATLRFLPNFYKNEEDVVKKGQISIKSHVHYANIQGDADLTGYYDCNKNFDPKCDLCTIYWKLSKSKNEADVEKSKLINRSTKWYSYVYVVEDENNPELEGKILVFGYGAQVKEKIAQQKNNELGTGKCNVFSLTEGKDFRLIIKSKGEGREKVTYESSSFLETSTVKLYNPKKKSWMTLPVENGKIPENAQKKLLQILLDRKTELENFEPKVWDDATKAKVEKVIAYLSGDDVFVADRQAASASNTSSKTIEEAAPDSQSADDFFSIEDSAE